MAKLSTPQYPLPGAAAVCRPPFSTPGSKTRIGEGVYEGMFGDTRTVARDLSITITSGKLLTLGGAPAISDLDELLIDISAAGIASVTSVTSTAGASWTLTGAGTSWAAVRTATGSEPATVTVVTSANVPARIRWQRWH